MADTASYYHAAYAVAGVLYTLYAASLVHRRRQVRARLAALDDARVGAPRVASGDAAR